MHRDGGGYAPGFVLSGEGMPARPGPDRDRAFPSRCAMIAAVNGRSAALSALLLCATRWGCAADDLGGAARELARKTAAFAGRGEPVSITWRNLSGLGSAELGQVRSAFEAALRDAGARPAENAATVDARVTLSENQSQYLLVEEVRKGDERQVWMAGWQRTA